MLGHNVIFLGYGGIGNQSIIGINGNPQTVVVIETQRMAFHT